MRYPLTIVYTTARREPRTEWFFDSLARQVKPGEQIDTIVVDSFLDQERGEEMCRLFDANENLRPLNFWRTRPKPTVWQGERRLTREDWWAKSNANNCGIILCETPWIAFVDDRSVLGPGWLQAIREAQDKEYAVCGSYEKHSNLQVKDGVVTGSSELLGADTRSPGCYPFDSFYGGSGALPLEWCLAVQGFSENICDGLGSEDSMFGVTLRNSGFPIRYDSSMRIIEDRTPGQLDGALKRADKNSHLGQQAKSWTIVRAFKGQTTSQNSFDIRNLRDRVLLNGESLSDIPPSGSDRDWYDNQKISDME